MSERIWRHRLPVVEKDVTRTVAETPTADLQLAQDFVDVVRQTYGELLALSGKAMGLAERARLLGYVEATSEVLTTSLPVEAMPEGLSRDDFVQAFAGMVYNVLMAVPDDLGTKVAKLSRGGWK